MKVTVAIVLDKRKELKITPNRYPVKVRVTFERKRRYYPTTAKTNAANKKAVIAGLDLNRHFNQKEFDAIMNAKRRTNEQRDYFNAYQSFREKAQNVVSSLPVFTFELFESQYKKNRGAADSLKKAFEAKSAALRNEGRVSSAVMTECALNAFEGYKPGSRFADVTPGFLKGFQDWMTNKGNSLTAVSMYSRCLRVLFNEAISSGLIDAFMYPFRKHVSEKNKYVIPTGRNIKKALTPENIERLFYHEADTESKQKGLDFWKFSYLASGMNIRDVLGLRWSDIHQSEKGEFILFERKKTAHSQKETKIEVFITPELKTIINRYGVKNIAPDAFIFPVFSKGDTEQDRYKATQNFVRFVNKNVKKVCKDLGIPPVTTYAARHSFATTLKREGSQISVISEMLGHSDVSVTKSYLDSFGKDEIKKAALLVIPSRRTG